MGCGSSAPQDAVHGETKGLLANGSDHVNSAKNNAYGGQIQPATATASAAKPPPPVDRPSTKSNVQQPAHDPPPKQQPPPQQPPKKPQGAPATVPMKGQINTAKDRYEAIPESRPLQCGGVKFRYAYLSQRGKYPDDPFKPNQDSFVVKESMTKGKNDAFFGVFDGHGATGDGCAIFTRNNMPPQLAKQLEKARKSAKGNEPNKSQIQSALLRAHVEVNKGLHKNPSIDDSLSGTTAISMYMHAVHNLITISNVGDSRAVIGQEAAPAGGKHSKKSESARMPLKAFPLSRDQTPYRKDERARIRATGARILSLDQLEGLEPIVDVSETNEDFELGEEIDEGGDPPRVWHPTGDYPGTAFTRSIGDAMAEDLGVFAEPEMLSREICPEDKIIVLASDGVYEFLTNQSVIDICAKFSDPLEACRAVVAEAFELWLQYELRTDDITMICLFIDEVKQDPDTGPSESARETKESHAVDTIDNSVLTNEGLRPVRNKVSKEKSKEIQKLKELGKTTRGIDYADEDFDWRKHATKKTDEEKMGIAEAIKASVMFRNINDDQREMIFACMESVHVKAGTWVIRQGTVGDRFYIIDEGRFEVRIIPDGEDDPSGEGGHIVHVYEGSRVRHAHPAFGELALMYSAPRSASIVAQSDGHLWALHRAAFRQVLMEAQDHRKELKKVLGEIPYFQYLDSDGINKLAAIMDELTFGRGENICEQGKVGENMFVVQTGTCYSVEVGPSGTKRANFKAGQYFGDEIFSGDGSYARTVVSLQTTTCWMLDANLLKQTMGPLLQGGGK